MPELPEVETIRRGLSRQLVGRTISAVRVRQNQLRHVVDAEALRSHAVGRAVSRVDRRAKYLLIHLEPDRVLLFHLGMSGRLWVGAPTGQDAKHDHLIFEMEPNPAAPSGTALEMRFHDPRRFGLCLPAIASELPGHPCLRGLGLEPFSEAFTSEYLRAQARRSRKPVKNFLMDATVVVGVGNIYASESLHLARLRPTRPVDRMRPVHWARLHDSVRRVLQAAIDNHGTSLSDYVDSNGERGDFQNELLVYGREGEPCARDGHRIKRIVQAGRSSFYCPWCQR
jgi:formamidopyrimidine-DNA glycosylase